MIIDPRLTLSRDQGDGCVAHAIQRLWNVALKAYGQIKLPVAQFRQQVAATLPF